MAKTNWTMSDTVKPDDMNALGTEVNGKLNSSAYTASDVLTKIKTVDGPGSGLDADTVDGFHADKTTSADTVVVRSASGNIEANVINSKVADGTSPLNVVSKTVVTNLNADMVDGLHAATASTANTIVARDANANTTVNRLIVTTGNSTSPFVISSSTVVDNLNADMVDGYHVGGGAEQIVRRDSLSDIYASRFQSTVADGTAPIVVASKTRVPNLNADMVDGMHADTGATASTVVARNGAGNIIGNVLFSTVADGTAPLSVASKTLVASLNADMVDGMHADTGSNAQTIAARSSTNELRAGTSHQQQQLARHHSRWLRQAL